MTRTRTRVLSCAILSLTAACATGPRSVAFAAPRTEPVVAADRVDTAAAAAVAPPIADGIGKSYTVAKIGQFMPDGDIDQLDTGFAGEIVFGRSLLSFLAIEGSLGYLEAEDDSASVKSELWAVPAFVNARASLPILFFEPYAGVGIGGMWVDYSSGAFSDDDLVFAYQGFLGLEVGLGRLALGAEYKYVKSDDTKDDFAVEGGIASITLSLPF